MASNKMYSTEGYRNKAWDDSRKEERPGIKKMEEEREVHREQGLIILKKTTE
jgi:hypothetical protein